MYERAVNQAAPDLSCDDRALVAKARRGDREAFGDLVRRHQDRIYNMCYRMCRDASDAADMAQETFLRALRSLDGFEERSEFFTWLYRIAVNQVLTHRRKQNAGPRLVPGSEPATYGKRISPAGESLEKSELHERLAAALAALPEEFRICVVLKDIEDFDYAVIGTILGVPVGTVKSRIHRGRMLLRDMLAEEESDGA